MGPPQSGPHNRKTIYQRPPLHTTMCTINFMVKSLNGEMFNVIGRGLNILKGRSKTFTFVIRIAVYVSAFNATDTHFVKSPLANVSGKEACLSLSLSNMFVAALFSHRNMKVRLSKACSSPHSVNVVVLSHRPAIVKERSKSLLAQV